MSDLPASEDWGWLAGRVARLEDDVKELRHDVKQMQADLAYLRGRVEQFPTTFTLVMAITTSQVTLLGFTFALLKFVVPYR